MPFPDERQSLETLAPAVTAIGRIEGRVVVMPELRPYATSMTFDPKGDTRAKVFGKITDALRQPVVKDGEEPYWAGVESVAGRGLLLEGLALTLYEVDPVTLKELVRRSVPWDLIQPPRDRGGEGTANETAALRAKLKTKWLGTSGPKAVGFAPVPEGWVSGAKTGYLVALRVPGFPLTMMECSKDDASSCMLTRQCNLEGAAELGADAIAGIAISGKRKRVLIGDRKRHRIVVFEFRSCYHVVRKGEILLPAKLKELTGVHVDADDRLWVTTRAADDYLSASVYWWAGSEW